MTDATYERIVAHVKANSVPPCDLFPSGLGLPLVVSFERPPDEPLIEPGRITMCMADYNDLRARAAAEPEALPTVRRSDAP